MLAGAATDAAAGAVYYSVGTSVADLKSSAPTVTINSGVATISIVQPNNIGVGDEITYGGATRAYISGRISSTQYTVTTATGAVPANVVGAAVNQIKRAFNLLSAAAAGSSDATHLNTTNLVSADVQLNWACYNDGLMNDIVTIGGYTTDASHYIRVFTPVSSSDVGASQRHRGTARTGFRLQPTGKPDSDTIIVTASFVRIEGLEIDGTASTAPNGNGGVDLETGATAPVDHYVSHNIIYGTRNYTGIYVNATSAKVWNNVLHKVDNLTFGALVMNQAAGTAYFYSNTVYNHAGSGIVLASGTLIAKNNVSMNKGSGSDFSGGMTQSNNVSGDATAAGAGSQINKTTYATYFKNTTVGTEDLHLLGYSLGLWGSSGADLSADASRPVTDDIDAGLRIRPDIGADEFGTCSALSTAEVPGSTVTVTAPNAFELVFGTAVGGGVRAFYDLAESPTRDSPHDLAGGLFGDAFSLWSEGFFIGATWYATGADGSAPWLDVLEATGTRVRVRQEAFYQDIAGPTILAGPKAVRDVSVYPSGRTALRWNRRLTAPVTYTFDDVELWAHYQSTGALSNWSAFSQSGALPNLGSDDFVLERIEVTGARTDFLHIMDRDWTAGPYHQGTADATMSQTTGAPLDTDNPWWRESTGATIPAGSGPYSLQAGETWSFLTYFKPTNLASNADAAVISRSADYRTPATPTINGGKGSQWQDAGENTGTGGDFYNESEAAYVFNLDPSLGLDFNISGVATTRYSPFFKIRQWRSVVPPQTITVDGVTKTRDVHFKADVKPVSRAQLAQTVRWHSTLQDSATALTAPDVGNPGSASGATAVAARYGYGLQVVGPGGSNYLEFQTLDFDPAKGAVEFWYRPDYASNDSADHYVAGFQQNPNNLFSVLKAAANTLVFTITAGGTTSTYTVAAAGYSWRVADWVHVRIEWNDGVTCSPGCVGQQRILLNGVEPTHTDSTVKYNSASLSLPAFFRIGGYTNASPNGSATVAGSIYDEVYVYGGSSSTPMQLAHGGLTSASDEYVGDPTRNATLGLGVVNATRQGNYLYFGADSRVRGLNIVLATAGGGVAAGALVWQYWRDTGAGSEGWTDLEAVTGFTDTTNSFQKNGNVFWTADPANWAPYSVNGGPDLYYVRVYLGGAASYAPTPIEGEITTDILLFQNSGDVTTNSNFVFNAPVPTAVSLLSFTASARDAAVELSWETASELQNLGFHFYRSESAEGPYARITPSLVPGLGSSPTGKAYAYRDVGLVNGRTYYYELEDVETTGRTERHGPVSATPEASAPSLPPCCEGEPPTTEETFGDPTLVGLTELERGPGHVVLELVTGGFRATPAGGGAVRLSIPGFENASRPGEPDLPIRRALVGAVAGRRVRLTSIAASDVRRYALRPAPAGADAVEVSDDGSIAAARTPVAEGKGWGGGLFPAESARLEGTLFQQETKKASVVFAPLRWNGDGLELARRLVVRLDFGGTERGETSLGGARGRRRVARGSDARRGLVAQLAVSEPGLQRVDYGDVFPSGTGDIPVSGLRLSRRGFAVPYHVEPDPMRFAPGSSLFFVSAGPSLNPYGDAVYELERGAAGTVMTTERLRRTGGTVTEATITVEREESYYYQAGLLEATDLWLWDVIVSPATRSYSFTVDHLRPLSAGRVSVALQGASDFEGVVDHHVRVLVNGIPTGEAIWDGKAPRTVDLEIPPGVLREGENSIDLENVGDTGAAYSMVFLDRFSVSYPRALVATGGRLEGLFSVGGEAVVEGLSAGAFVVDTTEAPRWVAAASTPAGLSFAVREGRRYLATATVGRPEVRWPRAGALKDATNRADYLLLAPSAFLGAAQPLLDLRASQGLVTKAVALEDVYEQFGYGEISPEAIKGFLEYSYQDWSRPSPRYVVLLGDASYDPRDYLGTGVRNWLPGFPVKTSYLWTVSDPAYAAVNGEDDLPDIAIGRLPAGSVEEAEGLVQKVLAFERGVGSLDGAAVLVADNPDLAGDFEADADEIAATVLADRNPRKIYYSREGASTRAEISQAFDKGASFLSYVGHGGTAVWASENIFNYRDVAGLAPQPRQPLLMTLNCLNGFFNFPPLNSLAEELVKAEGKGAIAAFSPSGLSVDAAAHAYHRALLGEIVSGRHARLGDALLAAQEDYARTGAFPELLEIYHLFGDPALRIR